MMKKILINETTWQTRVAITRGEELTKYLFLGTCNGKLGALFLQGSHYKNSSLASKPPLSILVKSEPVSCIFQKLIGNLPLIAWHSTGQIEDIEEEAPKATRYPATLDISKILKEGEADPCSSKQRAGQRKRR